MQETTDSLLRVEAIFNEALAAPYEVRKDLIAARSKGDRELIAEVCALLKAYEVADGPAASSQPQPETNTERDADPKRIGNYLLDRLLGRGGMGAVYLAHRADGHFEQKVAIKLIDIPLATEIFRQRFRQERQILAGLQHPYIARLLDGGVTAQGDPYLVMEYVDGVPIHRYCENHGLPAAERIALFLRVCEAVQFAHQNFVVHRDLKPDNILVAEDGTPRLLDFGTAKLLSPAVDNPGGNLTLEGYQSYTPQYASPEQVLGNPITTASDTYSLGVLLYLLLTGSLPYELKELTTAEMLRVICEQAPRRPSAANGQRLDPDLEAILLKTLRKEPHQRYLTAEQLSSDLRAYQEGLPVAARRGTFRYRAVKFIRRNRLALAAAALLAITLILGIAGVLWQAAVANQERRRAEASAADLRQLSNSLLSELDDAIKELPGSTGAQKLLVTRVLEHLDRMAKDAQGNRQTQLDLADAYTQLGEIQGDPYVQNLGDPEGALVSINKAVSLVTPLAADTKDRVALHGLALALEYRSGILFGTARTKEAIVSMRASVQAFDRLTEAPDATAKLIYEASTAYGSLGDELGEKGAASLADPVAALAAFRASLALNQRALKMEPDFFPAKRGISINQMKIGSIEEETDPALALKDFQSALQNADSMPKAMQDSMPMLRMRTMLMQEEANVLIELEEYAKADDLFKQVVLIRQSLVVQDPEDIRALTDLQLGLNEEAIGFEAAADPDLAGSSSERRRYLAAAEKPLAQAVAILEKILKKEPTNDNLKLVLAHEQIRLGTIQLVLHTAGSAEALAKKGAAVLKEAASGSQAPLSVLESVSNEFIRIEPAYLRDPQFSVSCAERAASLSHRQSPSTLLTLARAYRAAGQIGKSRATAKEGLALLPAPQPGSVKPRLRKLLEIQAQPAL
jgi:tetratricopeptide (TPR) repeat protein